jgi:hypothetical protein
MFKIVRRLDPSAQINNLPPKPKGIHWRTYERLAHRYKEQDLGWQVEAKRRSSVV